jgi:hypothetical protein
MPNACPLPLTVIARDIFPCSYKPPPEVGMQRVAGVVVDGGPIVGGMSREEVNAAQTAGITAGMQVQGAAMHIQVWGFHRGCCVC